MFIIQWLRVVGQEWGAAGECARRRKQIQANGQRDDFEAGSHKMFGNFIDSIVPNVYIEPR
jgi:hypothetical protein